LVHVFVQVVDEVESALLKTLTNQKAMRSSMLERRSGVATKISSLETTLAKLDANINDKDLCMALDSKALMLDGRSSPSRAPSEASLAVTGSVARSRSAASGRSSTRESIMSRLSQLEDDLRKTRESNEALERGIQDYQSSQY
jgi:septation ring formation regulator EzrA